MISAPTSGEFNGPPDARLPARSAPPPQQRTSPILIAVAWAFVSIPALWGVTQTVKTSIRLFEPATAHVVSAPTAVPAQSASPSK